MVSAVAVMCASVHAGSDTEYKVKAAYIYNFVKFVKWPPGELPADAEPFTICAAGPEHLGTDLEDTVRDKKIDAHPLVVRLLKNDDNIKSCQVLFLSGSEAARTAALISPPTHPGLLTVFDNDANGIAPEPRMITFVMAANRVRFAINNGAAERAGLTISSKLLALAVKVDR